MINVAAFERFSSLPMLGTARSHTVPTDSGHRTAAS
jgi:hypothetical protein